MVLNSSLISVDDRGWRGALVRWHDRWCHDHTIVKLHIMWWLIFTGILVMVSHQ